MTKLTTYTVPFRTEQGTAFEEIAASSPEAALAKARAIAEDRDRLDALCFEPYSDGASINEIVVDNPGGERVAEWQSADLLLRLAAEDLCSALERALTALNTAPRFAIPGLGTDSYTVAAECAHAIAKAKGDNNPNTA